MSKKIVKNLLALAMLSFLALPLVTLAQTSNLDVGLNEIENGFADNGIGNTDP